MDYFIVGWQIVFLLIIIMAVSLRYRKPIEINLIKIGGSFCPIFFVQIFINLLFLLIIFSLGFREIQVILTIGIYLLIRIPIVSQIFKDYLDNLIEFIEEHNLALFIFGFLSLLSISFEATLTDLIGVKKLVLIIIYLVFNIIIAIYLEMLFILITKEGKYSPIIASLKYIIFISFFIIFNILFYYNPVSNSNIESARDFLIALSHIESTILGIIIALSILIVQIDATFYSARILENMRRSPYLWTTILIYILSLTGVLWLIKSIPLDNQLTFDVYIIMTYRFGLIALLTLIPFSWFTFDLLNPIYKLKQISKTIKLSDFNNSTNPGDYNDPLKPLVELITGSISKQDDDAATQALNFIEGKFIELLEGSLQTPNGIEYICKYIFYSLFIIGKSSLTKNNEYMFINTLNAIKVLSTGSKIKHIEGKNDNLYLSIGAIECMSKLGRFIAKGQDEHAFRYFVNSFRQLGIVMAKCNRSSVADDCIKDLKEIAVIAIKRGFGLTNIIMSIELICINAIKGQISSSQDSLSEIDDMDELIIASFDALQSIGKISIKRRSEGFEGLFKSVTSMRSLMKLEPIETRPELLEQGLRAISSLAMDARNYGEFRRIVDISVSILETYIANYQKYRLRESDINKYLIDLKT